MEYLMNGEIYIKRGPYCIKTESANENDKKRFIDIIIEQINAQTGYEIIIPNDIEIGSVDEINYVISEIQTLPDCCKNNICKNTLKFITDFFNYILLGGNTNIEINHGKKAIYDYNGCSDFWQLFVCNYKIIMDMKSDNANFKYRKVYNCKYEIDKDFIKLSEFLDKATFIGKKFKRTKPIISENNRKDTSYMNPEYYEYIVLYSYNNIFLTKEIWSEGKCYYLLDSRYFLDGNYIFYGETYKEYKDKSMVFRDIVSQVINYKEEKNKKLYL